MKDGRIVAVGRLGDARATTIIDATGKYVTPGFIDIHSHADDGSSPDGGLRDPNRARRAAPNLVSQGITTVVVNQDGRSPWPISEQRTLLEKQGIGVNAMLLVGHGTVRRQVMKDDVRRPSTAQEQAAMRALLRQGLQEGAVGLSAGLEYEPGRWSTTDEVVELARELPPVEGIYISHERSEGSDPLWYVPSQDGPGAAHAARRRARDHRDWREDRRPRGRLAPEGQGRALLGIERRGRRPDSTRARSRRGRVGRSVSLSRPAAPTDRRC